MKAPVLGSLPPSLETLMQVCASGFCSFSPSNVAEGGGLTRSVLVTLPSKPMKNKIFKFHQQLVMKITSNII